MTTEISVVQKEHEWVIEVCGVKWTIAEWQVEDKDRIRYKQMVNGLLGHLHAAKAPPGVIRAIKSLKKRKRLYTHTILVEGGIFYRGGA